MYLFIDTETGGFSATEHSLLTLSAIITDSAFNIVPVPVLDPEAIPGCLHLRIKHDNYSVTPRAMEVNRIDLVKHSEVGVSAKSAAGQLQNFIREGMRMTDCNRLIPAGHNVQFDIRFVWSHLMNEELWRNYCTAPPFDTAAIARYLHSAKRISGGCSLPVLRQTFGIDVGTAHDAEVDNLATIELAKKFMTFVPPAD